MGNYRNFKLVYYFVAHGTARAEKEKLEKDLAFFEKYMRVDKVYLEPFRSSVMADSDHVELCRKTFEEHGVEVDVIIGTKSHSTLIMEQEMTEAVGEEHLFITTDDGSYKRHGMVTAVIEDLVRNEGRKYDVCVAIGPMIMMKFVCKLTKELELPTIVSMNPIMVDGTGMCGACRLVVDGEVRFACVDGPEFDGFKVDFDGAMKRMALYKTEEGRKLLEYQEGASHKGNCGAC